jgi:hypothetical protein
MFRGLFKNQRKFKQCHILNEIPMCHQKPDRQDEVVHIVSEMDSLTNQAQSFTVERRATKDRHKAGGG